MFDAPWLQRLTGEQHRAVTHDGSPLLVVAGAGTGKTTTLSSRVAWLLAQGVPAERVLLLTFTRRAAREMLTRTGCLLGDDRGRRVRGGTFHAVAHQTLRAYAETLGLPAGFSVLDSADAADVLDLLREQHQFARLGRRFPRKATLLDAYSRTGNAQQPLSEVLAAHLPWCEPWQEELATLFRGYVARKRELGVLDFDDLLLYWRALVRSDRLGRHLAVAWDHVLVDEYQDVNALQVDVLRALRRDDDRLTVVGDDAQAIYGFRAASTLHLRAVPEVFPSTTVVVLERNHRSVQPVLDVANAVSAGLTDCWPRRLRSAMPAGPAPELVVCHDVAREASETCRRILDHREAGIDLRRQAVLVRTAHHSDALELELTRRDIPFLKYGGLRFLEAAHVKDLLCCFRLADNPGDELSWFRVLQLLDGVGPATARRMTELLPDETAAAGLVPQHARAALAGLLTALQATPVQSTAARAEQLLTALRPLVQGRYPDAAVRLADLDHVVGAARDAPSLASVAADLAMEPPAVTADLAGVPHLDEEVLTISTIHSAKGLEWDVVHLLHTTDGNIPSDMSLSTPAGLAEEHRLFYVAVSRPRRHLHIYAPLRYHRRPRGRDDVHGLAQLSRFLTDEVLDGCERTDAVEVTPVPAGATFEPIAVSLADLWR
jgi:DNA helicase II / ATP-dependent DNA helicase PcrA